MKRLRIVTASLIAIAVILSPGCATTDQGTVGSTTEYRGY